MKRFIDELIRQYNKRFKLECKHVITGLTAADEHTPTELKTVMEQTPYWPRVLPETSGWGDARYRKDELQQPRPFFARAEEVIRQSHEVLGSCGKEMDNGSPCYGPRSHDPEDCDVWHEENPVDSERYYAQLIDHQTEQSRRRRTQ